MKQTMTKMLSLILLLAMTLSLAACGGSTAPAEPAAPAVPTDIVNGDFEEVSEGKWVGWTRQDAAFNFRGVTTEAKVKGVAMEKSGEYYFAGTVGGNPVMRGTLTSDVFKLGGNGFITFKMGGGKDTEKVYVDFFEEGKDTPIAHVVNEDCDGMFITEHLMTKVVDLSAYIGKNIYIVVTDNDDGSDLSYVNLDAFHVCTSEDEVSALEVEQLEKIQNETYTSASYDDLTSLRNYYSSYPYPVPLQSLAMTAYAENQVVDCGTVDLTQFISGAAAAFGSETLPVAISKVTFEGAETTAGFDSFDMSKSGFYTVTYGTSREDKTLEASFTVVAMDEHSSVANGGFESGNLAGWTVSEGWSIVEGQAAGVISATDYWGEKLPYNQAGEYHMDGWNNGFAEPEGWTLTSTTFTLGGSGFISVRMGGNAAAVHIFKADGTEIGYYKQNRFSDENFPHLSQGGSWADMGTYVIDLSDHVGEELYIVLADEVIEGGWAQAFFDEVVTVYDEAPDVANLYDTVADGAAEGETAVEVQIPWQLAENLI